MAPRTRGAAPHGPGEPAGRRPSRRPPRPLVLAVLVALLLAGPPALGPALAVDPARFAEEVVATAPQPTDFAVLPDGGLLVATQPGRLLRFGPDGAPLGVSLDLSARVCANRERGLTGLALHPAFAQTGLVYLSYTFARHGGCERNTPAAPVNRLARFALGPDGTLDPATETVLLDDIPSPDGMHNGGALAFGPDGLLYVGVGDGGCDLDRPTSCGGNADNARLPHVLLGKILRLTPDGGIPPANPHAADGDRCHRGATAPGRPCQETYATGLRNPFRITFDPNSQTPRFYVNDVGQNTWEEINEGKPGADYGWNLREAACPRGPDGVADIGCGPPAPGSRLTDPVHSYRHDTLTPGGISHCNAVTGGAFVPDHLWPDDYDGGYLFADFACGAIFLLTPDGERSEFRTNLGNPTALAFGPAGHTLALYYADFAAGEIRRIVYLGD